MNTTIPKKKSGKHRSQDVQLAKKKAKKNILQRKRSKKYSNM